MEKKRRMVVAVAVAVDLSVGEGGCVTE